MAKRFRLMPTTPLQGARCIHRAADGLIEARILGNDSVPRTGFFETPEQLDIALTSVNGYLKSASVYVTLNPVDRALLARAPNKFKVAQRGRLAGDTDITRRVWFPIDVDPVRPKDRSSTDEELVLATKTRNKVVKWLRGIGWPPAVKLRSGNGAHALFALDLENSKDVTDLIKRALQALDERFSTDRVKVDRAVYNASRIWKLPGTIARKGPHTTRRPHRLAKIEKKPLFLPPVARELLEQLANLGTTQRPQQTKHTTLLAAFKEKGWHLRHLGNGCHAVRCPWKGNHSTESNDTETVIYEPSEQNQWHGGFKCQHANCANRGIKDVQRELSIRTSALVKLSDVQTQKVHWFWKPYIPLGKVTLIEGDPGIGKSWLSLALAKAATAGIGPPGMEKRPPATALLLTGEDGLADTVRPRIDQTGGDPERIYAVKGPLVFDLDGCRELEDMVRQVTPTLIIVDPFVAYLGAKVDMHRANETREVLARLSEMAEAYQCAIVLIRHLTKSGKDKSIYRGLGSIDITAACRSVVLVGRDPDDNNRAVLVHIKSNLAKAGASITYTVDDGRFKWGTPTNITANQLLAKERDRPSAVDDAEEFLRRVLKGGPRESREVFKAADADGISKASVKRAKKKLGVVVKEQRDKKGAVESWTWRLPAT